MTHNCPGNPIIPTADPSLPRFKIEFHLTANYGPLKSKGLFKGFHLGSSRFTAARSGGFARLF
jgi:hypothetical protein